jgi:thiamine kinase-like enzyme
VSLRSLICEKLAVVGYRRYGPTLSYRMYRIPFGLYLRIDTVDWASRHEAEFESLRLVQRYTQVPVPTPFDTFQHGPNSYLLMTKMNGRPIGQLLNIMTDEQMMEAVQDLKQYITQLRQTPNKTVGGFQICNSLGSGILDWRIGDSKREELKFSSVADFHRYMTSNVHAVAQQEAKTSHDKSHEAVFTHADLNPRNILADPDTGKITGIVDWECSGWYPEYWEYTKAHFAVRYTIRWLADVVDRLFDNYREELWIENMLSDLVGPF